jgi:hypothetical protein
MRFANQLWVDVSVAQFCRIWVSDTVPKIYRKPTENLPKTWLPSFGIRFRYRPEKLSKSERLSLAKAVNTRKVRYRQQIRTDDRLVPLGLSLRPILRTLVCRSPSYYRNAKSADVVAMQDLFSR